MPDGVICATNILYLEQLSQSEIKIQSHVNKAGGVGFTSLNMFISQQQAPPTRPPVGREIPVMDASLHAAWFRGRERETPLFLTVATG